MLTKPLADKLPRTYMASHSAFILANRNHKTGSTVQRQHFHRDLSLAETDDRPEALVSLVTFTARTYLWIIPGSHKSPERSQILTKRVDLWGIL